MSQGVHVNRRGKDRVNVKLKAQYFIREQSTQYGECHVINLSRTGAAVLFPDSEKLISGATLFIDIYVPGTLLHVSSQAEIRRTERRDGKLICGIKFLEMISESMFQQLHS